MADGLNALLAISRELSSRLAKTDPGNFFGQLPRIMAQFETLFESQIQEGLLASWLRAARSTAQKLLRSEDPMPDLPPLPLPFRTDSPGVVVKLPLVARAAEDLYSRGIVTWDEFQQLASDARSTAFSIARTNSIEAISRIRSEIADNLDRGGSLDDFTQVVHEAIGKTTLSPSQIETIYRTQTAQAYSAGQRALLESPLVTDQFPYLLWSATHDSRVREDHLEMERFGQNGTAVYRRDDPIWEELYPPAGYNCRCVVIPLSIRDAARYGSEEAQAWLESGTPPAIPDWVSPPYPIRLPAGWPTHRSIRALG